MLHPYEKNGQHNLWLAGHAIKDTALFAEKHGVGKRFRCKIWRTEESKSLGSRGRLTGKVQSPFDSSYWAKRGIWDSR